MTEIITPFGKMDLVAGAGQQKGIKSIIKFGYNPDLVVDVEEDVTTFGGTYQFLSDAGEAIQLVSDNAADNQLIVLDLLDANFKEVRQTVSLNGTTQVPVPGGPYTRVNRMFNGNGVEFAGDIRLTDAATGLKILSEALAMEQQSNQMVFTIPDGMIGMLKFITISINKAGGSDTSVIFRIKTRGFEKVFRTTTRVGLQRNGTSTLATENTLPGTLPPRTDVKLTAVASSSSTDATGIFELYLIDKAVFFRDA